MPLKSRMIYIRLVQDKSRREIPTEVLTRLCTACRMWSNLGAIFKKLSTDDDVRCVVLSGKGDRAFTAGLDVRLRDVST